MSLREPDGAQVARGQVIRAQSPDDEAPATGMAEGNLPHLDASEGEDRGRIDAITGDWYTLGKFGSLRVTIGYYMMASRFLENFDIDIEAGAARPT